MRTALLACLAAFALLPGCSGPPAAEPAAEEAPCLVESPGDDACLREAAAVPGAARPHLHDYWGGRTRIALQDVEVQGGGTLCVDSATAVLVRPADGDAVIQGTGTVWATLEWEAQKPTDLKATTELWVRTAADPEPRSLGPIASGDTVSVPSDDLRNDLPHQALSAWEFHLVMVPDNPTGCFTYSGVAKLHVELERGPDAIPLYPGHPDRWSNATSLTLVDADRSVFIYWGDTEGSCLGGPNGGDCLWDPNVPRDGWVVPYDASEVLVTLRHADGPLRVTLAYHAADSREPQAPAPGSSTETERTYRIPVDGRGDGPYARQSQWRFWAVPDKPAEAYQGSFHVTVEALR